MRIAFRALFGAAVVTLVSWPVSALERQAATWAVDLKSDPPAAYFRVHRSPLESQAVARPDGDAPVRAVLASHSPAAGDGVSAASLSVRPGKGEGAPGSGWTEITRTDGARTDGETARADRAGDGRAFGDDGARSAQAADLRRPEDIKLVVRCAGEGAVAIAVTGLAYDEPRILGGMRFSVDGSAMERITRLEFSEPDRAWFPRTVVTRTDRLVEALRTGRAITTSVTGNGADGRSVTIPLAGSFAAIDRALGPC